MSVYAVSDMHGCADVYHKIKKIIKPEDIVYCLGDCGDRGPQPWETIKLVATDPQFIYLKGNHEDMLVKAAREAMAGSMTSNRQRLLANNGGFDTLTELLSEEKTDMWRGMLTKLPTYAIYTNSNGKRIFLSHAGCNIWADEPDNIPKDRDLLWDRVHYFNTKGRLMADDIVVVHGHTPIAYLTEDIGIEEPDEWVALKYCDGKKYCIDQGTIFSGHSILFNLDTFESIDSNLND
jgi:predicted phosphodiesterase